MKTIMTYHSKNRGDISPDSLIADLHESMIDFIVSHEENALIGNGNNSVCNAENTLLFEVCIILWKQPIIFCSDIAKLEKAEKITEWAFTRSKLFDNKQFKKWNYKQ
jgi:hypothetical protein